MSLTNAQKLQKCITDCVKVINLEFKNYCDAANTLKKHVSQIIAHRTSLSNAMEAKIEDTELYKIQPDIKLKLQCIIMQEIRSEEIAIDKLLNDLKKCYSNIIAQLDKICDTAKNCCLTTNELVTRSETCLSFAEMLEAVNDFRRFFPNDSKSRIYSLHAMLYTEDPEKLLSCWNISELMSVKQDFNTYGGGATSFCVTMLSSAAMPRPPVSKVCPYCNREFSSSWKMRRHVLTHTGEKPFRCGLCGKTYAVSDKLKTHLLAHEGKKKTYKCTQCSKSLASSWSLQEHLKNVHGQKKEA